MNTRILAATLLLATSLLVSTPASALGGQGSGCRALADAVRVSVERAWLVHAGARAPAGIAVPRMALQMQHCGTTAATVSAAFSRALRPSGLQVDWDTGGSDYCLSHYLDQCYPRQAGQLFAASASELAFVDAAWQGVRSGVTRQMPFGTGSDIAWFDRGELETTLSVSLDATLDALRSYRLAGKRTLSR
ncbi:MAG: hypothetical protein U5K76_06735 [Woeseiaceae bacterium]|nr:hypothetical protein [Woeseiaceae bacterium]